MPIRRKIKKSKWKYCLHKLFRQGTSKNATEFILSWPSKSTSGQGACPSMWVLYPMRFCWRKLTSLVSGYHLEITLGLGMRHLCPLLAVLKAHLVQSSAGPMHAASLCEFIWSYALFFLDVIYHPASNNLSASSSSGWCAVVQNYELISTPSSLSYFRSKYFTRVTQMTLG